MAEMDAAAYFKSGTEHLENGDFDQAITDTSEAIRLNPNDALAYGTRGAAYQAKKDYSHAMADFTEVIRLEPRNAFAYANRGTAFFANGNYNHAICDLERAVKLDPQNENYREILKNIKDGGKKTGCLGAIFNFIIRFFIKASLGGKIGFIVGLVGGIASSIPQPGNVIFFAPLFILIGVGIGTFVGFIIRKSSRSGKFGALIGAGTLGLACIIIGIVVARDLSAIPMAVAGIIVGFTVGIIIGNIVGSIKKRIGMKSPAQKE